MATFRSHDAQTKRCLTLCRVPLRNLAHLYGSGRVAAYTPNAHSLPLSSQAQSNTAATCDYTFPANKNLQYVIVKTVPFASTAESVTYYQRIQILTV